MDSVLIVLVVIGVVMILAGIARMKSKRKHSWDEIDHSVLFSKNEPDEVADEIPADPSVATAERVVVDDAEPLLATAEGPRFTVDDDIPASSDDFELRVDTDDAPEHRPASATTKRSRSILDKLRRDSDKAEEQEETEQKKGHKDDAPDKVIVLNVMAPEGRHFLGPALVDAIEASGLRYGDMQIFHYYAEEAPMFGLVNMVKPGIFDMANIEELSTPGVSLFIQMPSDAASGLAAFDAMLNVAQDLAQRIGGELRDETRSVLTHSAIDHIRQQIAEYDCKWLATA
jgi:cell division protein ZipA